MKSSKIDIFADDVYRNSIFIEKLNLSFCQFFVKSPSGSILCIETGMRDDFSQLKSNLLTEGINVGSVSSIVVPHFEVDEMGALPDFMLQNQNLITYAHPICSHALADIFSVKTKLLKDEVPITINEELIIPIFTKHVHQWDSLVIYIPRFKALFSSDIFMRYGTVDEASGSPLQGIIASIEKSGYLPSIDHLHSALKKIQKYDIDWIFPMHGPSIHNDAAATIDALIGYCTKNRLKEIVER
jgi:flavorubredoxin